MRVSDRTLRKWLKSGRPKRVERYLEDQSVIDRLEAMTALGRADHEALDALTSAQPDVIERVETAVEARIANGEIAALIDLVGLGWHTAAAVADVDGPQPED